MSQVTNWHQEIQQSNSDFISKSNQSDSLDWQVSKIQRAHQMTLTGPQIKTILMGR